MPHRYPKPIFEPDQHHIFQFCEICGEKRVAYASGSKAYFSKNNGAKMPFPTACLPAGGMQITGKVVSLGKFVKADQLDTGSIEIMARFIEAIFILKSVQRFGLDERIYNMIDAYLNTQENPPIEQTLSKAL